MSQKLNRLWKDEDGVLSFEWTLLLTLLVIGVVSGLAGARDAIIDEFGDAAQGMLAVDQSMTIDHPLTIQVHNNDVSAASDSAFVDALLYGDCPRADFLSGQNPQVVDDGMDLP